MSVSHDDREKWQLKYRRGAYAGRRHPASYLQQQLPALTPPCKRALDLACGAGRNALYLAGQGYHVDAVDIAREGLQRGRAAAMEDTLAGIQWHEQDLDDGLPAALTGYGLILMIRYLDIDLLRAVCRRLQPGGYILAEVHLQSDSPVAGPSSNDFRAAPGALADVAADLDIIDCWEGITADSDGKDVALARLLARLPVA